MMSAKPSAPAEYGYDQYRDPPPQYEALHRNAGQAANYGAISPPPLYPSVGPPVITIQPGPAQVILVGGCPACRTGVLQDDYTACGVICAVLLFPIGILCCLAMKQRRCSYCGAIFG